MVATLQVVGQTENKPTHREAYNLYEGFEQEVVYLASHNPRFWSKLGHELEADLLTLPASKLIMRACHAIATDTGRGPENGSKVVQRLKAWSEEGRLTKQQIDDVLALYDAVEDRGARPTEEGVMAELVPIVQKRMRAEAVRAAVQEYTQKTDMSTVTTLLDKANRLGKSETAKGVKLGKGSFEAMAQLRLMDRLPIGVQDLDLVLDGGLGRGQLGVAVGGAGDGKSMFLSHVAVEAFLAGHHVAYATLELAEGLVSSRLTANLTDIPEKELSAGKQADMAKARMDQVFAEQAGFNLNGDMEIHYFTPHATTVEDITDWVKRLNQGPRKVDFLVVDYADKMVAPKAKSEYEAMRIVYEGLRVFAVEHDIWCWTASQATRKQNATSESLLGLGQMADSINKARVADLVLTLNAKDQGATMTYFVAKNRTGQSQQIIGPMPTDFAYGRICPVNRR